MKKLWQYFLPVSSWQRVWNTGDTHGIESRRSKARRDRHAKKNVRPRRKRNLFLDRGLPDDILLTLAEYLSTEGVLALAQTSRRMYHIMLRPLYDSICLKSPEQCRSIARILITNPNITFIRRLVVHPLQDEQDTGLHHDRLEEKWFSRVLQELAFSGSFHALHTFDWAGRDAPDDELWLALRICCPHLKNIAIVVSPETIALWQPHSHLFEFCDLISFTLDLSHNSTDFSGVMELPERFWNMLLRNSPNLLHLSFLSTGRNQRTWNVQPILSARWRYLKSITLTSLPLGPFSDDGPSLTSFLSAHPTLENVGLLDVSLTHVPSEMPSLPRLRSFAGEAGRLLSTAKLPALERINLVRWYSPSPDIVELLRTLLRSYPTATAVEINISFQYLAISRESCFRFYESCFAACSQLTRIEITSNGPMSLKDFSCALRFMKRLRSFAVIRLCRSNRPIRGDEPFSNDNMRFGAMRIAKENFSLEWFTIRDNVGSRLKQMGTYHVVVGVQGTLRRLWVHEVSIDELGERSVQKSVHRLRL